MPRLFPPPEPAEPTEVLAALLTRGGVAWPLARGLAAWVQAVDDARREGAFVLMEAARNSTAILLTWMDDAEGGSTRLRTACVASLDLVNALLDQDEHLVERSRECASAALRMLALDLRTARPSAWAREHGLGW